MTGLLEAWIKLFSEPLTWRRLVLLSSILGLIIAGISTFEHYTWSFRLARLEKSADLLVRLQESEARGTNDSVEVRRARKLLMEQTLQAIEARPITLIVVPSTLSFSMNSVWKFFAGGALWYALYLGQIGKWRSESGRKEILGQIFVAVLAGIVAIFVPAIWWPWFHILIYPWLFIAGVVLAIAPVAVVFVFWSGLKKAKQRAQAISCLTNLKQVGLGARLWANDHSDKLPTDFPSGWPEDVTCCPTDRSKRYEILSPGVSESDPTVVYARCPIHDHIVFADGAANEIGSRKLVKRDGQWRVESTS